MHLECQRCVVLGLCAETFIPSDNDEALGKFPDGVDDVGGFEITGFSSINVEDLDGVLDIQWRFTGR